MIVPQSIPGGVFTDAIEGGRSSATLRVEPGQLTIEASGQIFALPLEGLGLELGGASGKMVFCRHASSDVVVFTEDPDLLAALVGVTRGETRTAAEEIQRRLDRRGLVGVALAVVGGVIVVAGGLGIGWLASNAVDLAVDAVPVEVEQKLGDLIPIESPTIESDVVAGALETLLARLTPAARERHPEADFDYRLSVVRDGSPNAFALPGGRMVFHSSLLELAQTPEEVAGVLAHEMAHVYRRHSLERMISSLGIVGAIQIVAGDVGGLLGLGRELVTLAALNSYSQEQEAEADKEACATLIAADIPPSALASMFERMGEQVSGQPGADLAEALPWLSSHPDMKERIASLQDCGQNPKQGARPIGVDWVAVRSALSVSESPGPPG